MAQVWKLLTLSFTAVFIAVVFLAGAGCDNTSGVYQEPSLADPAVTTLSPYHGRDWSGTIKNMNQYSQPPTYPITGIFQTYSSVFTFEGATASSVEFKFYAWEESQRVYFTGVWDGIGQIQGQGQLANKQFVFQFHDGNNGNFKGELALVP